MAKVAISVSDELLMSMDSYAKENYMTRSGFVSMCCNQFLQAKELQRLVGSMVLSMEKMAAAAESGMIDDATLKEFEQFKVLAQTISKAQIGK